MSLTVNDVKLYKAYKAFHERISSEFLSPCGSIEDLFNLAKDELETEGFEFSNEELNKLKERLFDSFMSDAYDVIGRYRSKDDCPDPSLVNLVAAMGLSFSDEKLHALLTGNEAVIRTEDVDELFGKLDDLSVNIGRSLVHGEINNDSHRDIVANIVSDVRCCLLAPLAKQLFPEQFSGLRAIDFSESVFPDDEDPEVLQAYEEAGFVRK